jgi:8-oxo-dGTP diphosphatase
MSFHIGVNVLVIRDGRILLGKRLKKAGYGTWGLVGGHLEFGESFSQGAARELLEETGLVATKLEFVGLLNTGPSSAPGSNDHYIQVNFVASEWAGEPENKEPDICEQLEWFFLDALPENIFPPHKDFIPAYLEKCVLTDLKV